MEQTEIPGSQPLEEKTFIVVKHEVYHQPVRVTARTKEEARQKAVDGDYTIHSDPEYSFDLRPDNWNIEEVADDEED